MTTASVRGKERDRIYEKKLIKERKIEDEEYGDKPKFVTSAYKQKLIDDQKWEAEDK
jgi:coiled-coil domain-containing protein 55